MKRASPPAPLSLRVHFASGGESLFAGNGDERVERRVVGFDSLEAGLRELHRGNGPASQLLRRLLQREGGHTLRLRKGWSQRQPCRRAHGSYEKRPTIVGTHRHKPNPECSRPNDYWTHEPGESFPQKR